MNASVGSGAGEEEKEKEAPPPPEERPTEEKDGSDNETQDSEDSDGVDGEDFDVEAAEQKRKEKEQRLARAKYTSRLRKSASVRARNLSTGQVDEWFVDNTDAVEMATSMIGDVEESKKAANRVMGRVQKHRFKASREGAVAQSRHEELSRQGRVRPGFVKWMTENDDEEDEGLYGEGDATTGWLPPNTFKARAWLKEQVVQGGNGKVCCDGGRSFRGIGLGVTLYFDLLRYLVVGFGVMTALVSPVLLFVFAGERVRRDEVDFLLWARHGIVNIGQQDTSFETYPLPVKPLADLTVGQRLANTTSQALYDSGALDPDGSPLFGSYFGEELISNLVGLCDILYTVFFFAVLKYYYNRIEDKANNVGAHSRVVVSDYSVLVRGLPLGTTAEEVRKHFSDLYDLSIPDWRRATWMRRCFHIRPPLDEDPYGQRLQFNNLRLNKWGVQVDIRGARNYAKPVERVDHCLLHMSQEDAEAYRGSWVADVVLVEQTAEMFSRIQRLQKMKDELWEMQVEMMKYHASSKYANETKYKRLKDRVAYANKEIEDMRNKCAGAHQLSVAAAFVTFNNTESLQRCLEDYDVRCSLCWRFVQPRQLKFAGKSIEAESDPRLWWERIRDLPSDVRKWCSRQSRLRQSQKRRKRRAAIRKAIAEDPLSVPEGTKAEPDSDDEPPPPRPVSSTGRSPRPWTISVEPAPDPTDIIWENMEYTNCERALRRLAVAVVLFIFFSITLVALAYGEIAEDALENLLPDQQMCQRHIPAGLAGGYEELNLNLVWSRPRTLEETACEAAGGNAIFLEMQSTQFDPLTPGAGLKDLCFGSESASGGSVTTPGCVDLSDTRECVVGIGWSGSAEHLEWLESRAAASNTTAGAGRRLRTKQEPTRTSFMTRPYEALWKRTKPMRRSLVESVDRMLGIGALRDLPVRQRRTQALPHAQYDNPHYTSGLLRDCFCFDAIMLETENSNPISAPGIVSAEHGDVCSDFIGLFVSAKGIVLVSSFVMIFVNRLLEYAIDWIIAKLALISIEMRTKLTAQLLYVAQFINTGLVLLLVNAAIPPLYAGEFESFTYDWYLSVGTQLMTAIFLNVFAPYLWPMFIATIYNPIKRYVLLSRGWHGELAQKKLHNRLEPPPFLIETKYPELLTNVTVILFYSGGFPILIAFGLLSMTMAYYAEKFLLLRYYRMPALADERIARFAHATLKAFAYFHLGLSFWFYSEDGVLIADKWLGPDNWFFQVGKQTTSTDVSEASLGTDGSASARIGEDAYVGLGWLGRQFETVDLSPGWDIFGFVPRFAVIPAVYALIMLGVLTLRLLWKSPLCATPRWACVVLRAHPYCRCKQPKKLEEDEELEERKTAEIEDMQDFVTECGNPPFAHPFYRMIPPPRSANRPPGICGNCCIKVGLPRAAAMMCFSNAEVRSLARWKIRFDRDKKERKRLKALEKEGKKDYKSKMNKRKKSKRHSDTESSDGEVGGDKDDKGEKSKGSDFMVSRGGQASGQSAAKKKEKKKQSRIDEEIAKASERKKKMWFQPGALASMPYFRPGKGHKLTAGQVVDGWKLVSHKKREAGAVNRVVVWNDAEKLEKAMKTKKARDDARGGDEMFTWEFIGTYGLHTYAMATNPYYREAQECVDYANEQREMRALGEHDEVRVTFEKHMTPISRFIRYLRDCFISFMKFVLGVALVVYGFMRYVYIKFFIGGDPKAKEQRAGTSGDMHVNSAEVGDDIVRKNKQRKKEKGFFGRKKKEKQKEKEEEPPPPPDIQYEKWAEATEQKTEKGSGRRLRKLAAPPPPEGHLMVKGRVLKKRAAMAAKLGALAAFQSAGAGAPSSGSAVTPLSVARSGGSEARLLSPSGINLRDSPLPGQPIFGNEGDS